jgi:hypothetical protein
MTKNPPQQYPLQLQTNQVHIHKEVFIEIFRKSSIIPVSGDFAGVDINPRRTFLNPYFLKEKMSYYETLCL